MKSVDVIDGYLEFVFRNIAKTEFAFQYSTVKQLLFTSSPELVREIIMSDQFRKWINANGKQIITKGN